jgi:RNA-directed DNA polymerase
LAYSQITAWENLLLAYRKAARHKRGKSSAAGFEHQLADHLLAVQADLTQFTYQPGEYVHFTIHDPKTRKISAAIRVETGCDSIFSDVTPDGA